MNSEDYFLPSSALQYGIARLQDAQPQDIHVCIAIGDFCPDHSFYDINNDQLL